MIKTAFTLLPMFVSLFWLIMFLIDLRRTMSIRITLVVFFSTTFLLYFAHALFFNFEYQLYLYFDSVYKLTHLAVYPLYFMYVIFLTRETTFRPAYFLLLLPAFILSGTTAFLYFMMGNEESLLFVRQIIYGEGTVQLLSGYGEAQLFVHRLVPVVFTVQLLILTLIGSRMIVQFDEKVRNYYADTEGKNLLWTRRLFLAFAFISLFSIVVNVLGRTFFLPYESIIAPAFIFSALLFAVGHIGYYQRFTAVDLQYEKNAPSYEEELFEENDVEYVYTSTQSAELKNKLQALLTEEKIYIRKDLRVVDLSRSLNTNRTYISRMINQEYGKSFSELINNLRFEEAKRMLLLSEFSLLSISEIAQRAGFPSESSFYRIFKKETGLAPGDWRKVNSRPVTK